MSPNGSVRAKKRYHQPTREAKISAKLTQLTPTAIARLRSLSDDQLKQACTIQAFRGSGPGGQKRNKTSSAVRVVHSETGLTGSASEERSQAINLRRALRRLRMEIAFTYRLPPAEEPQSVLPPTWPSNRSDAFVDCVATTFDWLDTKGWSIRDAAIAMNCSTAQLSNWLTADGVVLNEANRRRALAGLPALRPRE